MRSNTHASLAEILVMRSIFKLLQPSGRLNNLEKLFLSLLPAVFYWFEFSLAPSPRWQQVPGAGV